MGTARPGPGAEWWEEDFQLTISSYPDRPQDGLAACERLLARTGLPLAIEEATRRNATWYLPVLAKRGDVYEISHPEVPAGWARCNPSIANGPDGDVRIVIRTSNHYITPEGRYEISGGDDPWVIRTKNWFGRVCPDLAVHDLVPIDDRFVPRVSEAQSQVVGLEDCRLFWCGGQWMISANARDLDPDMVARQVVATLDPSGDLGPIKVLSDSRRHEKNWMPIQGAVNHPRWVYSVEPTIIKGDDGMGFIENGPYVLRHARGGSQVIPLPDRGHLAVIHEAVDFPDRQRVYQHRVVFFDEHLTVTRWSLPFCLESRGIEFAAGMALIGNDLLISYGVFDAKAMLLRMPVSEALAMLEEL